MTSTVQTDVLSVIWSLCTVIAPFLAVAAAIAVLPFFLHMPPATPAPPKGSLVKAPRPFDLATELGKAGRLLPVDEHQWWVSVQAPVLLAVSVAAIYTDDAR